MIEIKYKNATGWNEFMQNVYKQIADNLIAWYPEHARDLPWRKDKEPYHVWLSEIMLQQTRVEAVKEYYRTMRLTPHNHRVSFFNDTATTEIYTLSLHDALPI